MTVPTALFRNIDLTDGSVWTAGGSPTIIDDLHNPLAAYDLDGIDDCTTLDAGAIITTQEYITISAWVKLSSASTFHVIMSQGSSANSRQFWFRWGFNGSSFGAFDLIIWEGSNTNSRLVSTLALYDDGEWHHVICSSGEISGETSEMVVDGVDVTSDLIVNTSGFASFGQTASDLIVGKRVGGIQHGKGGVARPVIWGERLSIAQMQEEYADEILRMEQDGGVRARSSLLRGLRI